MHVPWGCLPHLAIWSILNIIARLNKSTALADRINPVLIDSPQGLVHNVCCAPCRGLLFPLYRPNSMNIPFLIATLQFHTLSLSVPRL